MSQFLTESEYSGHTMIAIYPDAGLAARLAVDGGVLAGDLHCTIVYTGRTDAVDEVALRSAAEAVTGRSPIAATINGIGRFSGTGGDPDAIVALVDSPGLETLRADVLVALADAGICPRLDHSFTAHITLAYVAADDPWPDAVPARMDPVEVTFTTVTAKWGDTRTEYVFDPAASAAETARRAYVAGWAATGAPLSDRVRAGCHATMALAETHPGVVEATLRLGHMEGTWALIFARRDDLHDRAARDAGKLWADLVDQVDVDQLVGDAEDAAAGFDGTAEHRTALATIVGGYLLGALRALSADPGWADLRQVVHDAVADAVAEGQANAAAIAADMAGGVGFDHDAAHADARAPVEDRADTWSVTDVALNTAVASTASTVGRRLVNAVTAGQSSTELQDMLAGTLREGLAVAVELRHAIDAALAASMWRLYQLAGMSTVGLVTVGDGRVCQACLDAETAGPYQIFEAPRLPMHYSCRCVLVGVGDLPPHLYADYLIGG